MTRVDPFEPPRTLEGFVRNAIEDPTDAEVAAIAAILEEDRIYVEARLWAFQGESEDAWAAHRDALWNAVVEQVVDRASAVSAILDG